VQAWLERDSELRVFAPRVQQSRSQRRSQERH